MFNLNWMSKVQLNATKRVFLSKLISLIKRCCFLNQFTKVRLRTFNLFFGQIYSDKTFHARIRIYLFAKQIAYMINGRYNHEETDLYQTVCYYQVHIMCK